MLLVVAASGCIEGNRRPRAVAAASPTAAFADAPVTFDANGSKDPDGKVRTYAWSFGDGSTAEGKQVAHRYAAAGSYSATLIVTDKQGSKSAPASVAVRVLGRPAATPTSAPTGSPITVALNDTDVSALGTIAWDLGDGSNASGSASASHTYADDGTFTVTVRIALSGGATISSTVVVTITNRAPTASIAPPAPPVVTNTPLEFSGAYSTDPDGSVANYSWAFSDGLEVFGQIVTRSFATPGTFGVNLTVRDDDGDVGKVHTDVSVAPDLIFHDIDDDGEVIHVELWVDPNGNLTRANVTVELRNLGALKAEGTIGLAVSSYLSLTSDPIDTVEKSLTSQVDTDVDVTTKAGGVLTIQGSTTQAETTLFLVVLSFQGTPLSARTVTHGSGGWVSAPTALPQ